MGGLGLEIGPGFIFASFKEKYFPLKSELPPQTDFIRAIDSANLSTSPSRPIPDPRSSDCRYPRPTPSMKFPLDITSMLVACSNTSNGFKRGSNRTDVPSSIVPLYAEVRARRGIG